MKDKHTAAAAADDFFDDEQELIAEEKAVLGAKPAHADKKAPNGPSGKPAEAAASRGTDAPPFWMVVAIAVIALLLGVVIGYLIGASTALTTAEAALDESAAQVTENMSASSSSGEVPADELPEGHPGVTIDEDGTAHVTDGATDGATGADAATE